MNIRLESSCRNGYCEELCFHLRNKHMKKKTEKSKYPLYAQCVASIVLDCTHARKNLSAYFCQSTGEKLVNTVCFWCSRMKTFANIEFHCSRCLSYSADAPSLITRSAFWSVICDVLVPLFPDPNSSIASITFRDGHLLIPFLALLWLIVT